MSPQAQDNWKGAGVGIVIAIVGILGGKMIDGLLQTDTINDIKQELKEFRQDIKDMRKDYVLKEDYDRDKRTMIELVRKK